jgi:hypothetical protein
VVLPPDEDDSDSGPSVVNEKSVHEPEEFDPDSLGPSIPEAPSAPKPPRDGSASEISGLFWKLVIVFNVALFGLSVGPMIIYFEGQTDRGVQVFLVGAIAFAYGYFRYRQFMNDREDEDDGDEDTDDDSDESASPDTEPIERNG